MKRLPKKARFHDFEPFTVRIDPKDLKNGISLPKVSFEVEASFTTEEVFRGMVLPIPKVLLYFLTHAELLVMSVIFEEMMECEQCSLSVKDIGRRLRLADPTVSAALYSLRLMGMLLETPNGRKGAGRVRKLDFSCVQRLNDLVEGEDPGVYVRIRKATRKRTIANLTKEDIKGAYDNKVAEPGCDPAELEEYD